MAIIIGALLLVCLGLSGLVWYNKQIRRNQEQELNALSAQVLVQNAAVDAMRKRNVSLQALADQSAKQAAELRQNAEKPAKRIMQTQLSGKECQDLENIVDTARNPDK